MADIEQELPKDPSSLQPLNGTEKTVVTMAEANYKSLFIPFHSTKLALMMIVMIVQRSIEKMFFGFFAGDMSLSA